MVFTFGLNCLSSLSRAKLIQTSKNQQIALQKSIVGNQMTKSVTSYILSLFSLFNLLTPKM